MTLPPSLDDWTRLYFRAGYRRQQPSLRVLQVVYEMLRFQDPVTETVRMIAELASVNPSTVSNVKDRLEKLGLVATERLYQGGRPLRWSSIWPPKPPD